MFKVISSLLIFSSWSLGSAQTPVTLGEPKPIDIHVSEVDWQPEGQALVYRRETENGSGLGIYGIGKLEGKVVIPVQKGETWNTYWLAKSNSALIVLRGLAPEAKTKSSKIQIFVVDADTQKAKSLFDQTFEEKLVPSVEVNTSPGLKHAIITIRNSAGIQHKVLPLGAGSLIDSPDLDRAEKEGLSGPNWSVDGTAVYSNLPRNVVKVNGDSSVVISDVLSNTGATRQDAGATFTINLSQVTITDGVPVATATATLFRFMPPMPKTGTSVLELMPANAVLRPVRFRGPWAEPKQPLATLMPQNQPIILQFDQSNAQDSSVWLTRGKQKGLPATLVAVHASQTWLSDSKTGIAYLIDGALFFRSIGN